MSDKIKKEDFVKEIIFGSFDKKLDAIFEALKHRKSMLSQTTVMKNEKILTKKGERNWKHPASVYISAEGISITAEYDYEEVRTIWLDNKEALRLAMYILREYFNKELDD